MLSTPSQESVFSTLGRLEAEEEEEQDIHELDIDAVVAPCTTSSSASPSAHLAPPSNGPPLPPPKSPPKKPHKNICVKSSSARPTRPSVGCVKTLADERTAQEGAVFLEAVQDADILILDKLTDSFASDRSVTFEKVAEAAIGRNQLPQN